MALEKGDFVLIEYTVRVKETGNIIDTTIGELAKREGIYESSRLYGPMLVVINRGWILKSLEEALKEMDVGEEKEIELPPEKAYGPRDPYKVKVFSIREFRRRGINVRVGDVIDFGGATGIVKSITGGRVTVDFNHPLAGKTLVYKVRIVKKLENILEKTKALVSRHLEIPMDEASIEYDGDSKVLIINIPTRIMTKKNIQYAKIALVSDIFELLKDYVRKVLFQEVFERKTSEEYGEERSSTSDTGGKEVTQ
ncbi:MAG: FKBP-type peptidyl-prolyl cis-trans isomerase [Desulfurococcales archaeon]|nr:FKBP-type peptidyl-prolyl cis-trans isomerase [Desulfurococcales archaeon]